MQILTLDELPDTVYHGTTTEHLHSLQNIKVNFGRKDLDFGQGFYTTSTRNQAIEWAKGRVWNGYEPLVLTYKINLGIMKSLKGIHFASAGDDWVKFIYQHRMEMFNPMNMTYDYVYGHTADGKTSILVGDIRNGKKCYDDFKREIYPTECKIFYYDQLFFRTEMSIIALEKVNEEVF